MQKYIYIQNTQIVSIWSKHIVFLKKDLKLSDEIFIAKIFSVQKQYLFQTKYSLWNIFLKFETFISEITININIIFISETKIIFREN